MARYKRRRAKDAIRRGLAGDQRARRGNIYYIYKLGATTGAASTWVHADAWPRDSMSSFSEDTRLPQGVALGLTPRSVLGSRFRCSNS